MREWIKSTEPQIDIKIGSITVFRIGKGPSIYEPPAKSSIMQRERTSRIKELEEIQEREKHRPQIQPPLAEEHSIQGMVAQALSHLRPTHRVVNTIDAKATSPKAETARRKARGDIFPAEIIEAREERARYIGSTSRDFTPDVALRLMSGTPDRVFAEGIIIEGHNDLKKLGLVSRIH